MTSTAAHQKENDSPNLNDFKHHLYSQLKAAGVMSSLKVLLVLCRSSSYADGDSLRGVLACLQTQLRSQVLSKLQKRECVSHTAAEGEDALWLSVSNSLVQQHLASRSYHYTLSVFQPEAGLSGQQGFGHKDILQIMQVQPSTPLHRAIAESGMLAVAGTGTCTITT